MQDLGYSFAPITVVLLLAITSLGESFPKLFIWLSSLFTLYLSAILYRTFYLVSERLIWVSVFSLLLMMSALSLPQLYFQDYLYFWYEDILEEEDFFAKYRSMDVETLMYQQPAMLDKSFAELTPQRQNITDIFYRFCQLCN